MDMLELQKALNYAEKLRKASRSELTITCEFSSKGEKYTIGPTVVKMLADEQTRTYSNVKDLNTDLLKLISYVIKLGDDLKQEMEC